MPKKKKTASADETPAKGSVRIYCDQRLIDAIYVVAELEGKQINEYVAAVLAERVGRPELAAIPRGKRGRPRKIKSE